MTPVLRLWRSGVYPYRCNFGIAAGADIRFCRAARVGGLVAIAQAAPTPAGESVAALGDVYAQTKRRLQIVLLQYAV